MGWEGMVRLRTFAKLVEGRVEIEIESVGWKDSGSAPCNMSMTSRSDWQLTKSECKTVSP